MPHNPDARTRGLARMTACRVSLSDAKAPRRLAYPRRSA